jgi:hypothetical protein
MDITISCEISIVTHLLLMSMSLIRSHITLAVKTVTLNIVKIDICWRYVAYVEVRAKEHYYGMGVAEMFQLHACSCPLEWITICVFLVHSYPLCKLYRGHILLASR